MTWTVLFIIQQTSTPPEHTSATTFPCIALFYDFKTLLFFNSRKLRRESNFSEYNKEGLLSVQYDELLNQNINSYSMTLCPGIRVLLRVLLRVLYILLISPSQLNSEVDTMNFSVLEKGKKRYKVEIIRPIFFMWWCTFRYVWSG